jgi:CRISPR/Cas system-associated endonuclease Cas1
MALAECEAVFALHAIGCDPSMGVVHQDANGRASFALDLLEPLRPKVEGFVLDLFAQRAFRKSDLVELPDGHVSLRPPLTRTRGGDAVVVTIACTVGRIRGSHARPRDGR